MVCLEVDCDIEVKILEETNAEELLKLLDDKRSNPATFLQLQLTKTPDEVRRFIRSCRDMSLQKLALYLGIVFKGKLAGLIRFELHANRVTSVNRNSSCNIAYWVGHTYAGSGLAYRSLRKCLPFIRLVFWSDLNITHFEADIHVDNCASQKVVRKLGFSVPLQNDMRERVLQLIAPALVDKWILANDENLELKLSNAFLAYESDKHRELESQIRSLNISTTLSSLHEYTPQENETVEIDCRNSLQIVHELEEQLHILVRKTDAGRVSRDDYRSLSWVGLNDFQGSWSEDDSMIIIWGSTALKGIRQDLDIFPDGRVMFGGFRLESCTMQQATFRNEESNLAVEWARLESKLGEEKATLNGIWRTPRGVVGVDDSLVVYSSNPWSISITMSGVFLSVCPGVVSELEKASPDFFQWTNPQSEPRKRSKKRSCAAPIKWHRTTVTESFRILARCETRARTTFFQALRERRLLEIAAVQRLFLNREGSCTEVDLIELDSVITKCRKIHRLLHFWSCFRRELGACSPTEISERARDYSKTLS
jgi:RimJ/RimL family protein N-acetyltransferase